jgi:hypothetical protein
MIGAFHGARLVGCAYSSDADQSGWDALATAWAKGEFRTDTWARSACTFDRHVGDFRQRGLAISSLSGCCAPAEIGLYLGRYLFFTRVRASMCGPEGRGKSTVRFVARGVSIRLRRQCRQKVGNNYSSCSARAEQPRALQRSGWRC